MLAELGQGVVDHWSSFADTAARIRRSLPPIYRTVYGSEDENAGGMVRDFHKNIKGDMPKEFGGHRYHALDPGNLLLGPRHLFDQVLYFTDTFVRKLARREGADVPGVQDLVPPPAASATARCRRTTRLSNATGTT